MTVEPPGMNPSSWTVYCHDGHLPRPWLPAGAGSSPKAIAFALTQDPNMVATCVLSGLTTEQMDRLREFYHDKHPDLAERWEFVRKEDMS